MIRQTTRSLALGALIGGFCLASSGLPAAWAQTAWHIDDDAPGDPGPGDPAVSDPLEDGSADHPFDAIQEGIDAAIDGDEVIAADGTYTGDGNRDLDFGGRAITVRSENGSDDCVIDCQQLGVAFYFHSGETSAAVVDGFTITRGIGWDTGAGQRFGGGIHCDGSSPTIVNCVLIENTACLGGGIYSTSGGPTIANCTITGNAVSYCGDDVVPMGGGIWCDGATSVVDGVIVDNEAEDCGGGMFAAGETTVSGCLFRDNYAYDEGGGYFVGSTKVTNCTFTENRGHIAGGAECADTAVISGCTFVANIGSHGPGGVGCSGNALVTNCTIAANTGLGIGGARCSDDAVLHNCRIVGNWAGTGTGGVACGSNSSVVNCSIVRNRCTEGGGVGDLYGPSSASVVNSIMWDNTPREVSEDCIDRVFVAYCTVRGGWPGTGNVDADPLFVDPDGPDDDPNTWGDNDYRLSAGSPCIDAGNNEAVPPDAADLDGDGDVDEPTPIDLLGNPRFVDDPGMPDDGYPPDGGPFIDMGTYEFQDETCFGDLDRDGEIGLGDLATLLAGYDTADGAVYTDGDLDRDGDVDLADLAALLAIYDTICP